MRYVIIAALVLAIGCTAAQYDRTADALERAQPVAATGAGALAEQHAPDSQDDSESGAMALLAMWATRELIGAGVTYLRRRAKKKRGEI